MTFIRAGLFLLVLAILGTARPTATMAQAVQPVQPTGPLIPELMGRWDVSFRSPQANLDTVWVIEPSASNTTSIGTVGNNPVGLAVTNAELSKAALSLTGTTTMGRLAITGNLTDDQVIGTFTAGSLRGDFTAVRRPEVRANDLTQIFDRAVSTFEQNLFTPAPFDAAWQARRLELRSQLTVPTATERDMVRAVRTLVAATRLSHNNFYIPEAAETAAPEVGTGEAVTWRRMENGLGYIRIDSFVEDPAQRDRLDTAFAELVGVPGLIVDLRGNGGGNLSLAMRLGDHLFPSGTKAGYFATRRGLDAAGAVSMDQLPQSAYVPFDGYTIDAFQSSLAEVGAVGLVTGGRAPPYAGRVALLIDGGSASSSEAMAAVMKETGRARLFGSRSAGEMLSSKIFPTSDAYVMRLAFADFRTQGGVVAEEVGVTPDQVVRGNEAAVVAAATRWLLRRR